MMTTVKPLRHVLIVSEQPNIPRSKAPLFAFGFQAIAEIAGHSVFTVKRHAKAGKFNPASLESVAIYLIDQRLLKLGMLAKTSQPANATASP